MRTGFEYEYGAAQDCVTAASRNLVVIDSGLDDTGTLLSGLARGVHARSIGATQSGLAALARLAAEAAPLDTLHIVSHGTAGAIRLGSDTLTAETLARHTGALASLRASLSANAVIVLYGCSAGAGPEGAALVAALEAALGVRVSATSTPTGAADKGGDWQFDIGAPVRALAFTEAARHAYTGLMAVIDGDNTSNFIDRSQSQEPDQIFGNGGGDVIITGQFATSVKTYDLNFGNFGAVDDITLNGGNNTINTLIVDIVDGDVIRGFQPTTDSAGDAFVIDFDDVTIADQVVENGDLLLTLNFAGGNITTTQRFADTLGTFQVTATGGFTELRLFADATADANDDGFSVSFDSTVGGNVLANDSVPNGGTPVVANVANGTVGTQFALPSTALLTINADGTFTYDPNGAFDTLPQGQVTSDTFTYTLADGLGNSATATVTLTITNGNAAPVAQDDNVSGGLGSTINGNVLENDTDIEGDTLTVTPLSQPTNGTLELQNTGLFSYSPDDGFTGNDSFTYTVSDGNGGSDTATVSILVSGDNTEPIANDDPEANQSAFTTAKDVTFTTGNVLANDVPAAGATNLRVVGLNLAGTQGIVTNNTDGTFTYNPGSAFNTLGPDQTATDSFSYTITDSSGTTDAATVTVTILGGNAGPVAVDDPLGGNDLQFTTEADTPFITGNVLANDTDPEGDTLSTAGVITGQTQGTAIDAEGGTFFYDPNGAFDALGDGQTATDTFEYRVSDGNGGLDTGTVTITVLGVNDAPSAADDGDTPGGLQQFTTSANQTFTTGSVLANDIDPDQADTLTIVGIDTSQTQGSVAISDNGTFIYEPDGGFEELAAGQSATDTFRYAVSDGNGGTDSATVTITIIGSNDAPIARNDAFNTASNGTFAGDLFEDNGFGADRDADGDTLSASLGEQALNGTAVVSSDGSFTYIANEGFTGQDQFTYVLTDENGLTDTATVTLNVFVLSAMVSIADTGGDRNEGSGANGTQTFTVSRTGLLSSEITLDYFVVGTGGAPVSIDDFVGGELPTGQVTLLEGESTAEITFETVGDYFSEFNELFQVVLTSPQATTGTVFLTNPSANGIILNDDGTSENLETGDAGNNKLKGSDLNDTLDGLGGRDNLKGRGGDDRLFGGDDRDKMDGGLGNDVLLGGNGDDKMRGREGDDILNGDEGADRIDGAEGDDQIEGGAGDDRIRGEEGNDIVSAGDGNDDVSGDEGDDFLTGGAGDDEMTGDEGDDFLAGDAGMDVLEGGAGDDTLDGGDDNDILEGEDGDDDLFGGNGDDELDGDDGNDLLDGGDGIDLIDAGDGDYNVFGGAGDDVIVSGDGIDLLDGGAGNDSLEADKGDDLLFGRAGDDILDADRGDDVLEGGTGNDLMIGGKGADVFIFGAGDGIDRIADFGKLKEGDVLDLTGFDGLTFDDFVDLADDDDDGVLIVFDTGDELLLEGWKLRDLRDEDEFNESSVLLA